jgi:hypothetical protein
MNAREQLRKRQVSGLLLIAAIILIIALCRADPHTIFPTGWWRFW